MNRGDIHAKNTYFRYSERRRYYDAKSSQKITGIGIVEKVHEIFETQDVSQNTHKSNVILVNRHQILMQERLFQALTLLNKEVQILSTEIIKLSGSQS